MSGVRVHNLTGFDLELPLGQFIAVTGVSGSGKSSLVFDALHLESQRRYWATFPFEVRRRLPAVQPPDVERIDFLPPSVAVPQRLSVENGAPLASIAGLLDPLRRLFAARSIIQCPNCDVEVRRLDPAAAAASLIQQFAQRPVAIGFRVRSEEPEDWEPKRRELLALGFVRAQVSAQIGRLDDPDFFQHIPPNAIVRVLLTKIVPNTDQLQRLAESIELAYSHGGGIAEAECDGRWITISRRPKCPSCGTTFDEPRPEVFHPHGVDEAKLRAYRVFGCDFREILARNATTARQWLDGVESSLKSDSVALLCRKIRRVLGYLEEVGLAYLTLDRNAETLSSGELRRAALSTIFESQLSHMLCILDEPTAGLHPNDVARLLVSFKRLRSAGNTVLVVEHDFDVISAADHVVELGPGAGSRGGTIVYQGPPRPTNSPVLGRRCPRTARGSIVLRGASANNLRSVDVRFPLGCLTCVCGPSGAGKSSLILQCLIPAIASSRGPSNDATDAPWSRIEHATLVEESLLIDQSPLHRSSRANALTYLKLFDEIRRLFSETIDARLAGLTPGDFSFNVPGGRCEPCRGMGCQDVDMKFLGTLNLQCPECRGRRFQRRILDVKLRGLDIAAVLDLTVRDAFGFFRNQPRIQERLNALIEVGLDYLRIGQPLNTLSGGESQRLRIAGCIARRTTGRVLYVLEEPTLGLHRSDVVRLLECLDSLIAMGHTVIAIEHDPQFLAASDYLIELGPGAGPDGGMLVAAGTPEEAARMRTATGRTLMPLFSPGTSINEGPRFVADD